MEKPEPAQTEIMRRRAHDSDSTALKRCLSLWEIVVYGVGLILGAGIYVLVGSAAGIAGNMLWLSFVSAAIIAGFTALSYAELSAMYPRAAAEYVYAREAFGSAALAWIIGFMGVMLGFTTASAVAVGFAQYLVRFLPVPVPASALLLIVAVSWLSYRGIKQSARFNAVATAIEVGGLAIIVLVGGYFIIRGDIPLADLWAFPVESDATLDLFLPVVSAGALIFFAYIGFEDIANIAEEAEDPRRVLPKAFIYSLVISTVIYVLVAVVAVSVVPYQDLATSGQPLSSVMERLVGFVAPEVLAVIALFATANTVLITLIVCARMIYGMADHGSLPLALARVHPQRKTPWVAVWAVGIITALFLLFEEVEVLASISDVGIFILFFFVNLSNIVLRFRYPDLERPWRMPLNIGQFPLLSALGAVSCLGMLATINHPVEFLGGTYSSLYAGLVVFALAVPLYFILGRRGTRT